MGEPGRRGAVGRRAVEAVLDGLVRRNRITLAVTVPAVGAVLLLGATRGLLPADVVLHPALLLGAVVAMRLPLVAGLLPTLDRRAVAGLAAVGLFAYGVEFLGVTTGVPYGEFAYTADLGPMVGGAVPLALPLLYLPLVVDACLLGAALLGPHAERRSVRVAGGVALLLVVDLVLDPGAVAVGLWAYAAPGAYYGVPLSNFLGWALTGSVAVVGVDLALGRGTLDGSRVRAPYVLDDVVSFAVLWGGVNLGVGNWLPAILAVGLVGGVALTSGPTDRIRREGSVPLTGR